MLRHRANRKGNAVIKRLAVELGEVEHFPRICHEFLVNPLVNLPGAVAGPTPSPDELSQLIRQHCEKIDVARFCHRSEHIM